VQTPSVVSGEFFGQVSMHRLRAATPRAQAILVIDRVDVLSLRTSAARLRGAIAARLDVEPELVHSSAGSMRAEHAFDDPGSGAMACSPQPRKMERRPDPAAAKTSRRVPDDAIHGQIDRTR